MADPYGLNQPLAFDFSKVVPRDQTGVDFLLISPRSDTSKRNIVDNKTGLTKNVQLAYKNVTTEDLTTGNLGDMGIVGGGIHLFNVMLDQSITEYYNSVSGRKRRLRYDFSESQAKWTDYLHSLLNISKSGKPRGGTLMNAIRTKFERVESKSVEDIRNVQDGKGKPGDQQQSGSWNKGWH
jgi:hypothetical protein